MTTLTITARRVPKEYRNKRIYPGPAAVTSRVGGGGTGSAFTAGNGITIAAGVISLDTNFIEVAPDEGVKLKYNNITELEVISGGIDIKNILKTNTLTEHTVDAGITIPCQLGVGTAPIGNYAGYFLSESINTCLMYDNTAMAQGVGGGILLGGKYTTVGGLTAGGFIRVEKENAVNDEYGFDLLIGNRIDNAAIATQIKIAASDGRVRINQSMDSMDTTFASGFTGAGWKLLKTGSGGTAKYSFEVDNLRVRGSMSVYELVLNKIRATNGSFWISDAGEIDSVDTSVSYDKKILFDTSGDEAGVVFLVNDIIRCQQWDRDGIGASVKLYIAQVKAVGADYIEVNMLTGASTLIAAGDTIVRMGNTATAARQNAIYLTASDTANPYIDMLVGVNSGTAALGGFSKLRLGNLAGINDESEGGYGQLSGYGLYAEQVYLKGSIYATNGFIGNWDINGSRIQSISGNNGLYIDATGNGTTIGVGLFMYRAASDGQVTTVGIGKIHTKDSINTLSSDYGLEVIKKITGTTYKHTLRLGGADNLIAGWNIDFDAIYSDTKHTSDGFASNGLSLVSDGGIHSKNFYVDADGDVGFRGKEIIYAYLGLSDTIILEHDGGEDATNQSTYQLIKTITLGDYLGINKNLRIRFNLKTDNVNYPAWGEIRRNGTPVGTPQSTTSISYTLKTENGTYWSTNDVLTLWIKTEGTGVPQAFNNVFTVCGELAAVHKEVEGTYS